jgi:hypothetical protein
MRVVKAPQIRESTQSQPTTEIRATISSYSMKAGTINAESASVIRALKP